jgi:hypothetical protein
MRPTFIHEYKTQSRVPRQTGRENLYGTLPELGDRGWTDEALDQIRPVLLR